MAGLFSKASAQDDSPRPLKPQNKVEQLLLAYLADKAKWPAFINALLKSELFLAGMDTGDGQIRYALNTRDDGVAEVMLYTSAARVTEIHGKKARAKKDKAEAVLENLRGQNVVLNYGYERALSWSARDLGLILGETRMLEQVSPVTLSAPDSSADPLANTIRKTLSPLKDVKHAALYRAQWPDTGEMSWYLDVRTAGQRDAVTDALIAALRGVKAAGLPTDIAVNQTDKPQAGGRKLIAR